ncbi:RraA family protein [Ramlibacter sp. WS9]|uniref:RraA family protein n=1 Tax=Ramlibacter sp. WS9 TaxID=1882741 RepID=UPI0011424928|nr:RraA family protein [Ramlibacter sp. WS9]ROZ78113.1 RraA family protein [Ramlibacter sp. WS9]HSV36702.1 dimethylmenaquinone methyltransferase [Ramlibacter sp.]
MDDTTSPLTHADLDLLAFWDTPTICNALELLVPGLPLTSYTTHPGVALDGPFKPMIGAARVGSIRARNKPTQPAADRFDWYDYVQARDLPTIVILQDLDERPGAGAFWGEVHSKVHLKLGARGCVTNGSFRDTDAWAPGFKMLGGCLSPSHAHVHLAGFGARVSVLGMDVGHDDIVHADHHGAVVIPRDCVRRLPHAIERIAAKERRTLDLCDAPDFSPALMRRVLKEGHIH